MPRWPPAGDPGEPPGCRRRRPRGASYALAASRTVGADPVGRLPECSCAVLVWSVAVEPIVIGPALVGPVIGHPAVVKPNASRAFLGHQAVVEPLLGSAVLAPSRRRQLVAPSWRRRASIGYVGSSPGRGRPGRGRALATSDFGRAEGPAPTSVDASDT